MNLTLSIVIFYKVDVDKNDEASGEAGIEAMPTFKFYRNGEEVHSVRGADLDSVKSGVADLK